MNALSELRNLPFTKVEQRDFADQAIEEILSGNVDPLQADLRLKAMEEVITQIRKDDRVKKSIIDEAEKYGKKFDLQGCSITVSGKTTKDFSGCDKVLDELYVNLEQLKQQIKAREATVAAGSDPATGEIFPPAKTSTTRFLTYKFK
ncbi:MAG: hypothetical protein M0P47_09465 [Bacteroidales bacterium]|nr:hypothetical protein [Bacteroidales bacterium]